MRPLGVAAKFPVSGRSRQHIEVVTAVDARQWPQAARKVD
jgi:hypothetical protein